MKKIMLILSLLLMLTGCGKKEIYGQIQSIEEAQTHTKLTLLGQDRTVYVDENTHVYSFSEEIPYEKLLDGELLEPRIRAHDFSFRGGKFTADYICVESILLPDPYVLDDGTELNVRKHHLHTAYEAKNGILLLWETDPIGPANVHGGSAPSLDSLNSQAQAAITGYYERQGLLYDLDVQLEKTHQAFLSFDNPSAFPARHLSQEIMPSASNKKMIVFTTILALPIDGYHMQEVRRSTVFDRDTGSVMNIADLFQCPEPEIPEKFLTAAKLNDPTLFQKMCDAFRLEYLDFQPDALTVWYPKNSLEGLEESHAVCVEYEHLTDLLHPWAIPEPME